MNAETARSEEKGRAVCPQALPMEMHYYDDFAVGIMSYYTPAKFAADSERDFCDYARQLIQVSDRNELGECVRRGRRTKLLWE